MKQRLVDDLRGLARRDETLAKRAELLRGLDAQVAALRTSAEAIDAFFAAYPAEESRRRSALGTAAIELQARREELREAEERLSAARDEDGRVHAEHAVERALDHVAVAAAAVDRAQASADELERDAASFPQEVPRLEKRARSIASDAASVPPPPEGVRELIGWAADAHAQLFVARGQLDAERERVIREANELASSLLGEQTFGSTVAQLAERVGPLAGE